VPSIKLCTWNSCSNNKIKKTTILHYRNGHGYNISITSKYRQKIENFWKLQMKEQYIITHCLTALSQSSVTSLITKHADNFLIVRVNPSEVMWQMFLQVIPRVLSDQDIRQLVKTTTKLQHWSSINSNACQFVMQTFFTCTPIVEAEYGAWKQVT